jgi:thiol-disulfide isomerase/thioredoxin
VGAAVSLLLAVAACTSTPPDDPTPVPFAACPEAPATPAPGGDAPDVALPCMADGHPVRLSALGRPAVVNLWASWCGPCRVELPALQRFADRAGDRVLVLGVITGDTRAAAGSTAGDLGVRFPAVFDDGQAVLHGLGKTGLPVTLLIDETGRIRHVYASGTPLDEASLTALVHEHLGVTVP